MTVDLLSNFDILNYSKSLHIPLHEVLSKDLFRKVKPKEGAYVVNLEDSDDGPGSHWTAFVIFNHVAVYYDSYGMPIPDDIHKFIRKYDKKMKIIFSTDQIQTLESVLCGWYVVFFLYFMTIMHPKTPNKKLLLNKHNAIFSLENRQLNDKILQELIKNIMKQ